MKTNLLLSLEFIIILILTGIILLQRCGDDHTSSVPSPKIDTIIKIDTQYVPLKDTVYAKPKPAAPPIVDTSWRDSIKLVNNTYDYLLERYIELGDRHFSMNPFEQTLQIDSLGSLTIKDTVVANKIKGRSIAYDFKYPVITKESVITVEQPYIPKRQLYLGGHLWGNQIGLTAAGAGIIYKDRKDRMFGANVAVFNSQINYGVSSYWKINLKK